MTILQVDAQYDSATGAGNLVITSWTRDELLALHARLQRLGFFERIEPEAFVAAASVHADRSEDDRNADDGPNEDDGRLQPSLLSGELGD